jgi:hypothetical protein
MAQNQPTAKILITIKREGCLGPCPVYSAEIYEDGTVVYHGEGGVKEESEKRHKIDPSRLSDLVAAFEKINYFSLKDRYDTDEKGRSYTDTGATTTSILLKGKYKKVVDYYGGPKELVALEDLIDKLAGLYGYIGPL